MREVKMYIISGPRRIKICTLIFLFASITINRFLNLSMVAVFV